MTEKSKYYVSKTAGDWIAGHRSPGAGNPVMLNEAQARTHLRNGEIFKTKTAMEDAEKKHAALVTTNKAKKAEAEKTAKKEAADKIKEQKNSNEDPEEPDEAGSADTGKKKPETGAAK